MNETLLALGTYRFSIDTAAYQTLKRRQSYRWQSQERLLRSPAQQFVGLGDDTITLAGVIYPHYRGGLGQLNDLPATRGCITRCSPLREPLVSPSDPRSLNKEAAPTM
jgi:phage protein U